MTLDRPLCRTSKLRHRASGVTVRTPLLIPSFSSKGFARTRSGKSELGDIFKVAGETITETFLVSAYDLYYGHLPPPEEFDHRPELTFVDSGGYEISRDRDYSSVIDPLPQPDDWEVEHLEEVADGWPEELPAVFVSYDHPDRRRTFAEQVEEARRFFEGRERHLSQILLKPETRDQRTLTRTLGAAIADVEELGRFDVVGLTEKELGTSMIDRMVRIARLRLEMDRAEVTTPLHIFGALDPVSVPLYYLAGAEIFDGLTWLRYGYYDGLTVYTHNFGALRYGLHVRDDDVRSRTFSDNYWSLLKLQERLREFDGTLEFGKLGPFSSELSDAWDSLRSRLGGRH